MAFYKDVDYEAFEHLMIILCFIEVHPDCCGSSWNLLFHITINVLVNLWLAFIYFLLSLQSNQNFSLLYTLTKMYNSMMCQLWLSHSTLSNVGLIL